MLLLDFQVSVADQPFAGPAVERAGVALAAARAAGVQVIFCKVGFRPKAPEIALSNPRFGPVRQSGAYQGEDSRIISALHPLPGELVIDKKRVGAFAGNDLAMILRAGEVRFLILAGLITSGVVLSTCLAASDDDYVVTVLSDACADRNAALHDALLEGVFTRAGQVMTVQQWTDGLHRANG
ncbi:cysteine hydrolase [Deinococcus sp.]|uniref:cysteine hydrolase n=1 Tax=Deinococcus sp. TaxID=47478 RepID=UPI003C7A940E